MDVMPDIQIQTINETAVAGMTLASGFVFPTLILNCLFERKLTSRIDAEE